MPLTLIWRVVGRRLRGRNRLRFHLAQRERCLGRGRGQLPQALAEREGSRAPGYILSAGSADLARILETSGPESTWKYATGEAWAGHTFHPRSSPPRTQCARGQKNLPISCERGHGPSHTLPVQWNGLVNGDTGPRSDALGVRVSYPETLADIPGVEATAQRERRLTTRSRMAKLPFQRTLERFDFSFQPSIDERQIKEIAALAFVSETTSHLLLGPPGVGKTRLSVAPAPRSIENGYGAYFMWPYELMEYPRKAGPSAVWIVVCVYTSPPGR